MSVQKSAIQILFVFTFLVSTVNADVLTMRNGDRLTGEVVTKDGDSITFKTEYAEPFKITWDKVKELKTDAPVPVILKDETLTETSRIVASEEPVSDGISWDRVAFVKPEGWRMDEWEFSGRVNAGLKFERGNNDTDDLDFDGFVELRDKEDRFTLRGQMQRDKANDVRTTDKREGLAKYDRFLNEKVYTGLGAGSESDKFADLNSRTRVGPHLGYQFFDDKRKSLSGEVSADRVWERFANDENENFWASGWRIDFRYALLPDSLEFYHRHNGLVDIENASKYLFDAWTGLRWPIAYGIVGSVEHQFEFVNQPAADAQKDDHTVNAKLGYEW